MGIIDTLTYVRTLVQIVVYRYICTYIYYNMRLFFMKIVTIATQKGGAGKTTLATNLAVASAQAGNVTLLIDADARQKTALEWFQKRESQENPLVMEALDQKTLFRILELAEQKGIDRVYIDTQGADAPLVNDAISRSNFCLMPCGSGGFDIPAQRITAAAVKRLEKDAAFIITKAPSRGSESKETRAILSGLGFHSPEHQTTNLKAYKDAAVCSLSVLEYEPNGKAAGEIKILFEWLEKKLAVNPLLNDLKMEVANHG
jgi:chromosome partitioning protein